MSEPSIKPPLPWTTPCKGTISLIPVVPPPPLVVETGFRVSSSGSGVGREGVWVMGRSGGGWSGVLFFFFFSLGFVFVTFEVLLGWGEKM